MQFGDLSILLRYIEYSDVTSWSQTREIMYSTISPYIKDKNLKPKDLIRLPIDKGNSSHSDVHTTEMSNNEIEWYNKFVENYKKNQT